MKTEIAKGIVIRSSRNIMTVRVNDEDGRHVSDYECRIKGKILKTDINAYNPAAPGDRVVIERPEKTPAAKAAATVNAAPIVQAAAASKAHHVNRAMIISVEQRRNFFSRFNQKGELSQLMGANIDLVLCVCTPSSPPFRPRFIDRVLLQAEIAGIEAAVICNKSDLESGDLDINERLEEYSRIGYKVLRVSAKTGEGIETLRELIGENKRELPDGKTCLITGQSGVGKSSIINALLPELGIKEGRINEKYDRGVHTTTLPEMYDLGEGTYIIDTSGVRLFIPDRIEKEKVIYYMKEFAPLAGKCSFGMSCSHRTECGCKILEAVHAGFIHEDRYESFLRIIDDLAQLTQQRGENSSKFKGKENARNN